jgi:hypothetical protein
MLQAAVQTFGQFLQSHLSALPQFAVQADKDLEEIEGQDENQQPGDDGDRVVMRAMFQVVVLSEFVESMVFDRPAVMANLPEGPLGIGV